MSIDGRIAHLKQKHETLDSRITDEERRPAPDTLQLAGLKKEKLKIKEELARHGVTT